jgi:predicted PurR-regulated permease PerM
VSDGPGRPRISPGERLRRAGVAAWSIIGLVILAVIVGWGIYQVRVIFAPLGLALLIIYLLNPVVTRLQRRGVPRVLGTILAYIVILGSITLSLMALVPLIGEQVEEFSERVPEFRAELLSYTDSFFDRLEDRFGLDPDITSIQCLLGADEVDPAELELDIPTPEECDEVYADIRRRFAERAGQLVQLGTSVLQVLMTFVVGPLVALYMLIDLPQIRRDVLNTVPEHRRAEFTMVAARIGRAAGGFFRGQLVVAFIVGVLSALGFWLIGLPFWLVIGALAGLFNLIPFMGPIVAGAIGFVVGTLTGGIGLGIAAAVVEFIVQQVESQVIAPLVMKRAVKLHPATVILALLAGGALAGIWGLLLAVPAVAVIKVVVGHVWATRVLGVEISPAGEVETPARLEEPDRGNEE